MEMMFSDAQNIIYWSIESGSDIQNILKVMAQIFVNLFEWVYSMEMMFSDAQNIVYWSVGSISDI